MANRKMQLSNKLASRKSVVTLPRATAKVGRNEPCPCGSERKYKDCHYRDGEAFLKKLALKEYRQALRNSDMPWYKRLFV